MKAPSMRDVFAGPGRGMAGVVVFAGVAMLAAGPVLARPAVSGYEYISPTPGSRFVSPENNIILRSGRVLNRGQLHQVTISVVGSQSGAHPGSVDVSDDRETVLFQPDQPFARGEVVTVTVTPKDRGRAPDVLDPLEFQFHVSATEPASQAATALKYSARDVVDDTEPAARALGRGGMPAVLGGDLLGDLPSPNDPPRVTANVLGDRTSGHTFVAAFRGLEVEPGFLIVLDEYRNPVFYRKLPSGATDFRVHRNGWIAYWTAFTDHSDVPQYYVMDTRGVVTDSITAGNGYEIDLHELSVLPNGHILLMCYDPQTVQMDQEVPGGRANASVIGLIVQELDLKRRVVFQWRSWDAYAFTDLVDDVISLRLATVDWVHGNAIAVDGDGNILISARHLNEVTKVSRVTGETLWRFGGRARNNQFTITNDPRGFSHQHHVRVLPNGHVTLFDNGNYIAPAMSRALEYELDENAKTANLVWEYRHTPSVYGGFLGSVQRFDNGGTLICWGGTFGATKFTELLPDGRVAYDAGFTPATYNTYRALRGPWRTTRVETDVESIDFGSAPPGQLVTRTVLVGNPGPGPIEINSVSVVGDAGFHAALAAPVTLAEGANLPIPVEFTAPASGSVKGRLYVGHSEPTDIVLQEVDLSGASAGGLASRRMSAAPLAAEVRKDDAGAGASIRYSLARPSRVEVAVFGVGGRRVATLQDGFADAGEHALRWDPAGRPDGVYFVRVRSDEGVVTRKLAVVR